MKKPHHKNQEKIKAFFVGAGFSKWAVGLPLVHELFDFKITNPFFNDIRKLQSLEALKEKWDQKNPNGSAEKFIADRLGFGNPVAYEKNIMGADNIVTWYIKRKLADPFIRYEIHTGRTRRHVLAFDESYKKQIHGMQKTSLYLKELMPLSGIITTNYDTVIEYALGSKGFHYDKQDERLFGGIGYPVSQHAYPMILSGETPLAKLHGSISWFGDKRYTNGRGGLTGRGLIIPPVPGKKPLDILSSSWNLAQRILKNCEEVIFFGFAFNAYDESILDLLKNNGRHIKSVVLVDPNPPCSKAKKLFPKATIRAENPP